MIILRPEANEPYVDGSGQVSETEVMDDASFVEEREIGNIIDAIKFGRIHLGECV